MLMEGKISVLHATFSVMSINLAVAFDDICEEVNKRLFMLESGCQISLLCPYSKKFGYVDPLEPVFSWPMLFNTTSLLQLPGSVLGSVLLL